MCHREKPSIESCCCSCSNGCWMRNSLYGKVPWPGIRVCRINVSIRRRHPSAVKAFKFSISPCRLHCDWIPCGINVMQRMNAIHHRNRISHENIHIFFFWCRCCVRRPHSPASRNSSPEYFSHICSPNATAFRSRVLWSAFCLHVMVCVCVYISRVARRTITSSTASIILSCILCSVRFRMSSVFFVHTILDLLFSVGIYSPAKVN